MLNFYKQGNYPQELGSGQGYTIARYGCALCCITSLSNHYGRTITPDQLNLQLVQHNGFASNGTKNLDGSVNKTLLNWGSLTSVFGEIKLEQNLAYPTIPADMGMVDAYLLHDQPVIVGVSFLHNPNDKLPSHYVLIYRKNVDGTYQCMDPWFGDDVVFDKRYAVNGMSVGNAILQVIAYSGPAQTAIPAPEASHPQQAVTQEDIAKSQADANYNLYLQEVESNKQKDDRIKELEQQVTDTKNANTKLTEEIGNSKTLNSNLAQQLSDLEAKDSAAVEEGLKAQDALKEKDEIVQNTAHILKAKPNLGSILQKIDDLLSINNWAKKLTSTNTTSNPAKSVLSFLGIKEVK